MLNAEIARRITGTQRLIGLAAAMLPPARVAWAGDPAPVDVVTGLFDLTRQEIAVLTIALSLVGFSVVSFEIAAEVLSANLCW